VRCIWCAHENPLVALRDINIVAKEEKKNTMPTNVDLQVKQLSQVDYSLLFHFLDILLVSDTQF
jgi:hypothetical protein